MTRCEKIGFTTTWVDKLGQSRTEYSEFKLGLGPCGKIATSLYYDMSLYGLTIIQYCDIEMKTFIYPIHSILSRIDIS